MGKIVAILSYIGLGLLLSINLVNTNPELDVQDRYFMWAVVGLSGVALLTAFTKGAGRTDAKQSAESQANNGERRREKGTSGSGFGIMDGLVLLFFLYLLLNYQLISQVDASAKWLQTVYFVVLYGSLRILLPASKGEKGKGRKGEPSHRRAHEPQANNGEGRMEKFLVAAIVFCGLWESVLGLMQQFGYCAPHHHLFSFTGTYVNTGPYGGFLAITMSIALGFMVKYYQQFNRQCQLIKRFPLAILTNIDFALYLLSALSFCASFTVFFAAVSRAAILGLLLSAAVIMVTQPYTKRLLVNFFKSDRKKKTILLAAVVALLFVGMGATYWLKKESADGRVLIWKVSSQVIAKQPAFGAGFGSFFGAYSAESADYFTEYPTSPAIAIADVPEYGFNEYLLTGVETGVVGMTLLLSILFLALYRLIKAKSLFGYGLIVLMVFSFFSYPFSQLPFPILLALFVAAAAGRWEKGERRREKGRIPNILFCLLLLLVGLGLSGMYESKIEATEAWKQVRMLYRAQHYEEARKECAELYPLLKDNPRFLFEYGHALNKTERFAQSNAILKEGAQLSSDPMFYNVMGNNYKGLGDYVRAEESYRHAFDILPNRIYPLYLLMKLYAETDQPDKANEMAQRVVDFPPKIDSPAIRDMKREAKALLP